GDADESAEAQGVGKEPESGADHRWRRFSAQSAIDTRHRANENRGGSRAGIRGRGGTLFWTGTGASVGEATGTDGFDDGAGVDHARVGGTAGFSNPISERAATVICRLHPQFLRFSRTIQFLVA